MYLRDIARRQEAGRRLGKLQRQRGVAWNGDRLWTAAEDDVCRRLYPDYTALALELKHRTLKAIQRRCENLRILKSAPPSWTAKRDALFRTMYRRSSIDELREAFPDMTIKKIYRRGCRHKLTRPRRNQYGSTGNALLDGLRNECFRLKVTMADLDEFARSGRYFQDRRWKTKVNYNYVVSGIKELGGTITVQWDKGTLQ